MTQPDENRETVVPTEEEKKAQKRRNLVIALTLVGFAVLVFAVTVLRLSSNISAGGG